MAEWRFMDYHTPEDDNLIWNWYSVQNREVQAEFDAVLLTLSGVSEWDNPEFELHEFKVLTGKHVGLGEIRFSVLTGGRKRRFRPMGIWPPLVKGEFILLLGCEKSGRSITPHAAFDLGLKYKRDFENGIGYISEHRRF